MHGITLSLNPAQTPENCGSQKASRKANAAKMGAIVAMAVRRMRGRCPTRVCIKKKRAIDPGKIRNETNIEIKVMKNPVKMYRIAFS